MKYFRFYIIFLLFCLSELSYGQYIFQHFDESDGLPVQGINCITQDNLGFIWMGSGNGIIRFDGKEYIHFKHNPNDTSSIPGSDIIDIFATENGEIYACTQGNGVVIIDIYNFSKDFIKTNPDEKTALSSVQNLLLIKDNASIWFSCSFQGIDQYFPINDSIVNFKPSEQYPDLQSRLVNTFTCGVKDPSDPGVLWFGTLKGIFSFNQHSKQFTHYPIDKVHCTNKENWGGREEIIRDILFLNSHQLYFASWGGGLACLDIRTGLYKTFKYQSIFPVNGARNNIKKILIKDDDELWFAAQHEGLGTFNLNTGRFIFAKKLAGHQNSVNHPSDLLLSDDGTLFASSYSSGLFWTNPKLHQFNFAPLPEAVISGKIIGDSLLFCGSHAKQGKLYEVNLDQKNYSSYQYVPMDDLKDNFFTCIPGYDDQKIWLVESFNLYYFDFEKKQILPYQHFIPKEEINIKDPHHFFRSASLDYQGNIWLGSTFNGIFKIDPLAQKVNNFLYEDQLSGQPSLEEFIFSMYTDSKGRIWYGTQSFGFIDPNNHQFHNVEQLKDTMGRSIQTGSVVAFTETADQKLWFGTESAGIGVIDLVNDIPTHHSSITQKDGLPDNQIWDMITDHSDNVWVATPGYLSRIITSSGIIENYGKSYGIGQIYFLDISSSGHLIAGTANGYYYFHPDSIQSFKTKSSLYLKSFKIFDEPIAVHEIIQDQKPMKLKYDQNFFSIEFGMINYFREPSSTFEYLLEGLDEQWQQADDRTYLSYTNLAGGNYQLNIKEKNSGKLSLIISIETPYWKTWWFYTLIILGVLGFLLIGHFYRLSQIRRQEQIKTDYSKKINQLEMKALRAQMNPHFLFNSLNSIRYYILKKDNENASEYITKFSKLLRLILNNSRHNQISLQDELYALEIYIEFEQMRFNNQFEYQINIQNDLDINNIQIQPLTLQPFVENAIWHGLMPKKEKGQLSIEVKGNTKKVEIWVTDNGVGRKEGKKYEKQNLEASKSFGLKITEDRMNLMENIRGKKSDFKVIDLFENKEPQGTRVVITFEL